MKSYPESNERAVTVTKPATLPFGVHGGVWSGYVVRACIQGEYFEIKVVDGLRGINIPCTVRVEMNGSVTVETE